MGYPNYRRARALVLEIEALRETLDFAMGVPGATSDEIDELHAELRYLESELALTGVISEYDL